MDLINRVLTFTKRTTGMDSSASSQVVMMGNSLMDECRSVFIKSTLPKASFYLSSNLNKTSLSNSSQINSTVLHICQDLKTNQLAGSCSLIAAFIPPPSADYSLPCTVFFIIIHLFGANKQKHCGQATPPAEKSLLSPFFFIWDAAFSQLNFDLMTQSAP